MNILADTGPLYALATPSDQYHERAYTEVGKLRQSSLSVITLYPILFETYSLLLRRLTPARAHQWLEKTLQEVGVLSPSGRDYQDAVQRVAVYSDQTLSLYDGLLAVMSERLELPIWTFDTDFDTMQADVWR